MDDTQDFLIKWQARKSKNWGGDMLAELKHEIEILQSLHNRGCLQTHDGMFVKNQLDDRHKRVGEIVQKQAWRKGAGVYYSGLSAKSTEDLLNDWDNRPSAFYIDDAVKRIRMEIDILESLVKGGCQQTRDGLSVRGQITERHEMLLTIIRAQRGE